MQAASTIIDLMRHGEVAGEVCYRGWKDDPLSTKGWQQMTAQMPAQLRWQQIITSPLRRCASFAEQLSRDNDLPLSYLPDLREIGFGDWEGKTADILEQEDKAGFFAFYDDPFNNTPNNAEPFSVFQQRVLSAWQQIMTQYAQRRVLVTTHAGTIRVILAAVLGVKDNAIFDIKVSHASIHRVEIQHGLAKTTTFSDL